MKLLLLLLFAVNIAATQQSPHGQLSVACEKCHSPESWAMRGDASFKHDSTNFPLLGRHKYVTCGSCHGNLEFVKQSMECASCHTDVHKSELGNHCLRCHTMESWIIPDMKQKHLQTQFPLFGGHAILNCEACHERATTFRYAGTPLACISCHQADYKLTRNPSHEQVKFPVDCSQCHAVTAMTWPSGFSHERTSFPLTGAHKTAICSQCHTNNKFRQIATDCFSCHVTEFTNVQSPNHLTGQFSHSCQSCHTTIAWRPSTFNHTSTRFALTGKHQTAECQSCHVNGNYDLTYSNCIQCHQTEYDQSGNPNHVGGNFPRQCESCHSTNGWGPASFDHTTTEFPLTGSHIAVPCNSCHTNGNYQLTYTTCYVCHQTEYQNVTNPNHVSGNFSYTCQPCHATSGWIPATFDHSTTNFALTGAHTTTPCQSCHSNGNYQITYTDCYQCHAMNYQNATNPNHVGGNFSHNCETCHSTTAWSPATFDHTTTQFPLTGAHMTTACQSCHINGNYQITYTDCYQCHTDDYQRPANPNHVALTFSHDCTPCHTTTAWLPSTFDHDGQYFKIYSGKHRGKWSSCSDCHTNPSDYNVFSCINCHEHNQADMDDKHSEVPNYVYASSACYSCHRND